MRHDATERRFSKFTERKNTSCSSKVALRRNTRRKQRAKKLLFILSAIILKAGHALFLGHRNSQASLSMSNCPTSLDVNWLSHRSKLFTSLWKTHKTRNFAVYVCVSTRHLVILNSLVYHTLTCPDTFYDTRYDQLFEVPRYCFSHGCLRRYGRSHYVYAEFVLRTYETMIAYTTVPSKPTSHGKIAVLLEPRPHPLLEFTTKQVMYTLGSTWALQVFVSSSNENFVRKRLRVYEGDSGQNIVITKLGDFGLDDMSKHGNIIQSAFSAHEDLYHNIRSEHILWFQVDVVMREPPKEEWLKYAYVGAEWKNCEYPTCSKDVCPHICGGGNSGLSLRRRSLLVRVATRGYLPENIWGVESTDDEIPAVSLSTDSRAHFASDELHDNSETRWFQDDLQLSYKLARLGLLPPDEILPRFAVAQTLPREGLCKTNPSGMHKVWDTPWISPVVVAQLFAKPFKGIWSLETS